MGLVELIPVSSDVTNYYDHLKPCLDAEKEERPRARPNLAHQEPVFNSQLDVSTVCSERETMPNVLVPVPPSTWLPSWSIWLLKSLSWPAMLLVTTKRLVSFQDIFNWLSGMTKLNKLLSGVTIAQGGVLPNIQAVLLPKK